MYCTDYTKEIGVTRGEPVVRKSVALIVLVATAAAAVYLVRGTLPTHHESPSEVTTPRHAP